VRPRENRKRGEIGRRVLRKWLPKSEFFLTKLATLTLIITCPIYGAEIVTSAALEVFSHMSVIFPFSHVCVCVCFFFIFKQMSLRMRLPITSSPLFYHFLKEIYLKRFNYTKWTSRSKYSLPSCW